MTTFPKHRIYSIQRGARIQGATRVLLYTFVSDSVRFSPVGMCYY